MTKPGLSACKLFVTVTVEEQSGWTQFQPTARRQGPLFCWREPHFPLMSISCRKDLSVWDLTCGVIPPRVYCAHAACRAQLGRRLRGKHKHGQTCVDGGRDWPELPPVCNAVHISAGDMRKCSGLTRGGISHTVLFSRRENLVVSKL